MAKKPKSEEVEAEEAPQAEPELIVEGEHVAPEDTETPKPNEDATLVEPHTAEQREPEMLDDTPAAPRTPENQTKETRHLGGLVALAAGGIIAGAIGFVAGKIDPQATWPFADTSARFESVESDMGRLDNAQTEIAQRVDGLSGLPADVITATQAARTAADNAAQASSRLDEISGQLAAMDQRIADLENRPIPDVGATQDAVDTYKRELTAMRQMFEEELARIEAAQKDTADLQVAVVDTGRMAAIRNGLSRLSQDVQAGGSIATGIRQLQSAEVEIPAALSANADDVPGLQALQDNFPDAARQALAEALRAQAASGEIGRVEAFLKIQLGARSLEPREGDDPDAILARSEAALRSGDVAGALEELTAFPDVDAPAMDDWKAQALRQADVMAATQELENTLLGEGNE